MMHASPPPLSAEPAPVGIIGGGPVGLLSALLLARNGIRSVLLEQHDGLSSHPKAMGISRRTGELFRRAGLLSTLEKGALHPTPCALSIWSKTLVGEELGRSPMPSGRSPATPCTPLHCPQTWTEETLLKALEMEPKATICFRHEVTALSARPDGARVSVETPEGAREFFFPYLLAADGAGSPTRHTLDIPADGPGDMGHFINTLFRADYGPHLKGREAVLYPVFTEEGLEFFVTVNGQDQWLVHHFLQPGESFADYPEARLKALIRAASGLPEVPVQIISSCTWVMSPKVAARFRHGRVFLVGDAAARLSPSGGLGMNTGLQSAENLVWKLAAVIKGEAEESLLDTYEAERRPASLATLHHSDDNAGEVFTIVDAAIRDDWEGVRRQIAASRRNGSNLGIDLGLAYESGALVPDGTAPPMPPDPTNDYIPTGRPGGRAPHLWVTVAGKLVSTLDLFGKGFTLLVGSDGEPWEAASCHVSVQRNGAAFREEGGDFEPLYGITPRGAVLVRPDGVVAARWPEAVDIPEETVAGALKTILGTAPRTV